MLHSPFFNRTFLPIHTTTQQPADLFCLSRDFYSSPARRTAGGVMTAWLILRKAPREKIKIHA
jgi:hypothetical protein